MISQRASKNLVLFSIILLAIFGCDILNKEERVLFEWEAVSGLDATIFSLSVTDKGTILAGTMNDGIYLKKRGQEWKQSDLRSTQIRGLVGHPSGKIFAATLSKGIWVSSDDGESWVKKSMGAENELRLLNILVLPSGRILVGVFGADDFEQQSDIYFSDDEGETWTGSSLTEVNAVWSITSDPKTEGILYCGSFGNIYKSTDYGVRWTRIASLESQEWMGMTVTPSGRVIAVGDEIISSDDSGSTWNERVENSFTGYFFPILSVGNHLFVGETGDYNTIGLGILRSTDNGETWESVNSEWNVQRVLSIAYSGNKLYMGTPNGVFVCNFR